MVIRKPVALWLMKKSIFMDKKLLIPAVVVIGLIATYLVATPVLAVIGHKMMGNSTMSKITGSVNIGDAIKNFTKNNQKVPFSAASATAEKQVANGNVLGGHIGIAQGYLVYTFFVVNPENQTGYKVIVDAGNGQYSIHPRAMRLEHLAMVDLGCLAMVDLGRLVKTELSG